MDWLIGILLLLVGGIIGYFVAKFVNERKLLTKADAASEQTAKELMVQQANNHIQESKQIAQQLVQQAQTMNEQINAYEQLIINMNTSEDGTSLSYFGEHAAAYLRHNSTKQSRDKAVTEFQPLDFASQGSGLFSGTEEKKAK
ncbi:MAG: DUF1043 family protein [Paraglaciecola sp.]|nr:DUF1043 family protein [Paraglaciecola sp.]